MARRSSTGNKGLDQVNASTGLREPFPSSPTKPPKYAVYGTYPHDAEPGRSRLLVVPFLATYAAKHFVETLLQGGKFKWQSPTILIGENGVKVKSDQLEEIIEYEYVGNEASWELPSHMTQQAEGIRREYREDDVSRPDPTGAEGDDAPEQPTKPKREPKPEKPKIDKSGLVSVGEIAEQMGIEARDARGALRKQKVEKPDGGWLWTPDKVDGIKKIIKAGLK